MTPETFMNKWADESVAGSAWVKDPATVFWARSYKMPAPQLKEMSQDFISLPAPHHASSSLFLAREILNMKPNSGTIDHERCVNSGGYFDGGH